ncbi:MBL fold metallo-hydrolase [Nocardia sp. NPDC051321]|uniref:MBL fold metallo-hydrolase n=1 Tax=Nocardia sp. NPDC051321 TaxID=3364323 RepID=UPI0037B6AEF7
MTLGLNRYAVSAPIRSHQLGELRVTYLPDGVALLEPRAWFPSSDDDLWIEHSHLLNPDGYLVASIGALLVEIDQHAMLIDAGFGPLALPSPFGLLRGGQLLKSLAAVGKTPRDIDLIALTHLHLDHLGWLWQSRPGQARSPFAHTEVLISTTEWAHRELAATDGIAPEMLEVFAHQVHPINDGEEIFPGVEALATPGHSLGHMAYQINSGRRRLIALGDAMTSPIQISHPHLTTAADDDPDRSITTALHLIDELCREDTLGVGIHFGDVQLGHVARSTDRDQWEAEPTW